MNSTTIRFFALAFFLILSGSDTAAAKPEIVLAMPPVIAARDVTPDSFSFTSKLNVPKSSFIASGTITVTGINRILPVELYSISSCKVSIDNGPLQNSGQGEVEAGQKVSVQLLSSPLNGTRVSCRVKIGKTESTFAVTTSIPPPVRTCASEPQTVVWKGNVWQRCDNGRDYTFSEAAEYCGNLNLGGYYNWELPRMNTMVELIVCDNGNPDPSPYEGCAYDRDGNAYGPFTAPTIDPVFQSKSVPYWYTEFVPYSSWWYQADFATGALIYEGEYKNTKVRCIASLY